MYRYNHFVFLFFFLVTTILSVLAFSGCSFGNSNQLKVYTRQEIVDGDSTYIPIPDFSFTDQDGNVVNNTTIEGKIFVTDFFFTSCPSICPRMKSQMKRIYEKFNSNPNIILLSHSIDPEYDSVEVLKEFADKLDARSSQWHLVTGDKDKIYSMAKYYMVTALENPKVEGGYEHSGHFVLLDKKGLIRGFYDGTNEKEVDLLIEDIGILLLETE